MSPKVVQFPTGGIQFGSIIKDKRKAAHMSQGELAEALNVHLNTIANWESDKSKPDYSTLPQLCSILHLRLYDLFGMDNNEHITPQERTLLSNYRFLDSADQRIVNKMVDTLLDERMTIRNQKLREHFTLYCINPGTSAAGVGDEVPDAPPTYDFLLKNNKGAEEIVKVNGHSMEPVYMDGDYVYFKRIEGIRPGMHVIVDTSEGAVIKRVKKDGKTLESINPDYPFPEKYDGDTLKVRGQVVGIVQDSDWATKDDRSLLEDIFSDEIRKFQQTHHIFEE